MQFTVLFNTRRKQISYLANDSERHRRSALPDGFVHCFLVDLTEPSGLLAGLTGKAHLGRVAMVSLQDLLNQAKCWTDLAPIETRVVL